LEWVLDGTGRAGFDRRAARLQKKLDRKLREVRRDAVRPADPGDDRPSLSAGGDLSDVEVTGAFGSDCASFMFARSAAVEAVRSPTTRSTSRERGS